MVVYRKQEAGTVQLAPEIETKVREWVKIHADYEDFKAKMETAQAQAQEIAADLIPIIKATDAQMVRIDNAVVAYKSMSRSSVKYKEMFAAAMEKVNAATQKVLEQLKEDSTTVTEYESLQVKQFGWLGDLWGKVKGKVVGWWEQLVATLSDGADELESIVEEANSDVEMSKRVDKRVRRTIEMVKQNTATGSVFEMRFRVEIDRAIPVLDLRTMAGDMREYAQKFVGQSVSVWHGGHEEGTVMSVQWMENEAIG